MAFLEYLPVVIAGVAIVVRLALFRPGAKPFNANQ
jgi:hypothetical protein